MSINWPKPHFSATSEFQVAGWPFVTSSITPPGGVPVHIAFPFVTQWLHVKVTDNGSGQDIFFGFTQNGVNDGYRYRLSGGTTIAAQTPIFSIKCSELWVRSADVSKTVNFSVIAGLTNVSSRDFPVVSGSNGYDGVG